MIGVTACILEFLLVRFLVFELMLILYFTVVNATWDLNVAWQGSSVAWPYEIDADLFQLGCQSKSIRSLGAASLVRGGKPPAHFIFL